MSRLLSTFRLGLKSLWLHKLRSSLAILGILIGVTAVIWLVAMGEGVSRQAQEQIKELGATNIIVRSVKPPTESSRTSSSFFIEYGLTREDFQRIVNNVPTVVSATPLREIRKEVRYRDRVSDARLVGCTPGYREMNHLPLGRGRFLSDQDGAELANVCVIADSVAKELFPYEDPIGRSLQIDRDFYEIIGQMANRTPTAGIGGSLSAQDFNQDVYIPLSTLRSRIGDKVVTARSGSSEGEIVQLSQVTVTVGDLATVDETSEIIRTLLEKYHKLPDYAIVVPQELLRQARVTQIMFNVLLVFIAGISLLVGGIGIMNIMLATVTERTREIGIRRALGARQRDIVEQFLSETIVLSATGGLLGVILGMFCEPAISGLRSVIQEIFPDLWTQLPENIRRLEPHIAPWSVAVAFLTSVGVGVVFGLYPARRAARMDPIEALRHE